MPKTAARASPPDTERWPGCGSRRPIVVTISLVGPARPGHEAGVPSGSRRLPTTASVKGCEHAGSVRAGGRARPARRDGAHPPSRRRRSSPSSCPATTTSCPSSTSTTASWRIVFDVAVTHLELGRVRAPGRRSSAWSPRGGGRRLHPSRSVLFVVADDVPFIVDSVRIALDRHGLGIHLLVHPMLDVERDGEGRIVGLDGGNVEAWTQIEIDRCDDELAKTLETESARSSSARCSASWPTTRRCASRLDSHKALDPLIDWLANDHYMFLGAADYDAPAMHAHARSTAARSARSVSTGRRDPPPAPSREGARHRPDGHRVDDPSTRAASVHLRRAHRAPTSSTASSDCSAHASTGRACSISRRLVPRRRQCSI